MKIKWLPLAVLMLGCSDDPDFADMRWRFCDGTDPEKFAACLDTRFKDGECLLVQVDGGEMPVPADIDVDELEGCLVIAPETSRMIVW